MSVPDAALNQRWVDGRRLAVNGCAGELERGAQFPVHGVLGSAHQFGEGPVRAAVANTSWRCQCSAVMVPSDYHHIVSIWSTWYQADQVHTMEQSRLSRWEAAAASPR